MRDSETLHKEFDIKEDNRNLKSIMYIYMILLNDGFIIVKIKR